MKNLLVIGYDLYKYSTGNVNGESAAYWNDLSSKYNVSDGDDIDHERNKPINIASKLKTYSLSYYNYNKVTKTEKNIKYTASLKSYANYTPAKPSELPSYYVFGGWYKDKACTTKFDFNTEKMPNANVQIYAKWTAKKINLTYNLNTPDGTSKKVNSDVEAGTIASTVLPSATTISDYSFAGWYYADGNGNITKDAFNANEAITKDTSVIGKWLYNGELTVVYDPGEEGSNAKVPTDSNIYAGGAKVTVAKNATTTSKKKFLGWELNRNLYYPGDAFEVNKNLANDKNVITLTAVWGSEEHSTTMSYNPGNGRGSVQTVPVKNNNESVTLKSEKDWGYQAPEVEGKEYYFAGWATSMEDANNGKSTYAAGQTVHVDVKGENVLYATWVEKTVITVTAKSGEAKYTGESHTLEGLEATKFTVDGNEYTVSGLSAKVTGTDADSYTSKVTGTAVVKDKAGKDVTAQFTVKTANGTLTISPRSATLTSQGKSREYNGKALELPEVTVEGDGFVNGEVTDIKATGSITRVGKVTNTITYTPSDKFKEKNYTITKHEGELSITEKSIIPDGPNTPEEKKTGIKVTAPKDTKYNGKEQKKEPVIEDTKTGKTLDKDDYSLSYSTDVTNAGTVTITVTGKGNYSGKFEVTYKINPRKVTLKSTTASKPYDGTALTKPDVTVSGDGFVEGEGASYEVTGSQTEVGNSANSFEYKLNEKTLASNYNITKVVGTLTITAAPAPVTPATPSTPSSTTSTTPRTPSAPQVTTPVETVEKETTPKAEPKKEEKVEEEYTPKASPQYYWALINLICAILTVLFGLLLLISKRHKSENDDEEDDDETKQQTNNDDEEKEQEKKRGLFTRVLAVLIAIVSVVFFLVTEDLSLPWTWTDQWTIWMVVIGLVQIVVFFVGRKWKNVDNDDDDEEAQQA